MSNSLLVKSSFSMTLKGRHSLPTGIQRFMNIVGLTRLFTETTYLQADILLMVGTSNVCLTTYLWSLLQTKVGYSCGSDSKGETSIWHQWDMFTTQVLDQIWRVFRGLGTPNQNLTTCIQAKDKHHEFFRCPCLWFIIMHRILYYCY